MKKLKLTALLVTMAMTASLAGCGNSASEETTETASETATETESAAGTDVFTDENGVLTYLDTANAPFEGAGLKITVDKAAKTVNFVKTDLDGNETVEYYTFDFNSNTVEEYYYVSMMGTGFYYTFDLAANEIVKVEDSEHNDSTQSTKDSGRYDGANDRMKGDVKLMELGNSKPSAIEGVIDAIPNVVEKIKGFIGDKKKKDEEPEEEENSDDAE